VGRLSVNSGRDGCGGLGVLRGGKGLVCEFNGQGRVYLQSRNVSSLVGWLTPQMPV